MDPNTRYVFAALVNRPSGCGCCWWLTVVRTSRLRAHCMERRERRPPAPLYNATIASCRADAGGVTASANQASMPRSPAADRCSKQEQGEPFSARLRAHCSPPTGQPWSASPSCASRRSRPPAASPIEHASTASACHRSRSTPSTPTAFSAAGRAMRSAAPIVDVQDRQPWPTSCALPFWLRPRGKRSTARRACAPCSPVDLSLSTRLRLPRELDSQRFRHGPSATASYSPSTARLIDRQRVRHLPRVIEVNGPRPAGPFLHVVTRALPGSTCYRLGPHHDRRRKSARPTSIYVKDCSTEASTRQTQSRSPTRRKIHRHFDLLF